MCQELSTAVLHGWEDVDAGASVDAVVAWVITLNIITLNRRFSIYAIRRSLSHGFCISK